MGFYLWDKGQPLLIDAGKYAYKHNAEADYVASPYGHNVVVLSDLGPMRERLQYGSGIQKLKKKGERYILHGELRYNNGIVHGRILEFKAGHSLIVRDQLENVQKPVQIHFLLAHAFAEQSKGKRNVEFRNRALHLRLRSLNPECKVKTFRGYKEEGQLRGWYSPKYGSLNPTTAVIFECPPLKELVTEITYQ